MNKTAKIIIGFLTALVVALGLGLIWAVRQLPQQQPATAPAPQPFQQDVPQQVSAPAQVGVPTVPVPTTTQYIGNSRTMKFHRADCEWAQKIADRNKVTFQTRTDAVAQGYTTCYVCRP